MNATITYVLSPAGQKAALQAGLVATRDQEAVIEISQADFDLFEIDGKGAMSADLRWGVDRWKDAPFDSLLTAEAAVAFLRERLAERAALAAAEAAAQQAKKAEQAEIERIERIERIEMLRRAVAERNVGEITCYEREVRVRANRTDYTGYTLKTTDADPEVAAMVASIITINNEAKAAAAAEAKAEAQLKALLDTVPAAPVSRPVTLQSDGRFALVVPEPANEGAWSKHVTSVDASGQDGSAFDGPWLKCGYGTVMTAGDMIVAGSKYYEGSGRNGSWHKTRDLYLVTPAGVLGAGGNTAALGAELLALDPSERVTRALDLALKTCEARLAKIDALDSVAVAAIAETVAERRAAWCLRQAELQAAIDKAAAPAPITTVVEACAALIAAGYKALAATHHPDRGGDAVVMGLLTDARNTLRQMLALATEAVQS